jgi:leader peptidase (prepilin peptidase) / N-methyltransferase
MDLLPEWYVIFILFVLGLIIGSFLDVLISRFHTGKSINGRSRCMSCGHTLSWYELFPLLSYLVLKGRCRNCGGKIPARLFFMEVLTACLFVYVYLSSVSLIELVIGLFLIAMLIVVAVYDIDHMVIPHEFVYVLLGMSLVMLVYASGFAFNMQFILTHAISAVAAFLFYGGLWKFSKGKWIGLGDAKLAIPLGLLLAPGQVFSVIVLSFWIGALVSVGILIVQKFLYSGKHRLPLGGLTLTMKSEVPFAPFLITAFILVYFSNIDVLQIMTGFF